MLEKYFSEFASWEVPTGSFYVWVKFNTSIALSQLFDLALKQHILINPGTVYRENGPSYIRLSYSYEAWKKWSMGSKHWRK
ncbi:hypothetical protein [Salipaludibacillus sp. CF4.18]|uniref:hypothetical protein n=1 Tax=Salipaludibacillus sp. CF4.18 TaxID=3373081 RepID=UPI003EE646B8